MAYIRKAKWYRVELLDGVIVRHRTVKIFLDGQDTLKEAIRRKLPKDLRHYELLEWEEVGRNFLQ